MLRRWIYRVRQFRRALGARPHAADLSVLDRYLTPAERRLFEATAPRDQHHHLETLRLLARHGEPSPALARAALLHDTGKGFIHLHERVLYVLLAAAAPWLLDRLSRRERAGVRGALYRTRHHAHLGAETLRRLGVGAREIDLVARHHDDPGADAELRALIAADDEA